jgi:hypothetical protein
MNDILLETYLKKLNEGATTRRIGKLYLTALAKKHPKAFLGTAAGLAGGASLIRVASELKRRRKNKKDKENNKD